MTLAGVSILRGDIFRRAYRGGDIKLAAGKQLAHFCGDNNKAIYLQYRVKSTKYRLRGAQAADKQAHLGLWLFNNAALLAHAAARLFIASISSP